MTASITFVSASKRTTLALCDGKPYAVLTTAVNLDAAMDDAADTHGAPLDYHAWQDFNQAACPDALWDALDAAGRLPDRGEMDDMWFVLVWEAS